MGVCWGHCVLLFFNDVITEARPACNAPSTRYHDRGTDKVLLGVGRCVCRILLSRIEGERLKISANQSAPASNLHSSFAGNLPEQWGKR